ncbi:NAD(P)H-dependent oxidoreductase [Geomesophilobacter sediminis]|uniref:NAD(P)H-dependent oxidoreductase n=1 Tax=Geomesophilobacter sediminis TaxID=2798584 RepID=A0A8J7LUV3_9BACT|nr:NAD(P)H-dependent oxidoreductase [Geomesophilobacter sediminis]MBJ6725084.1 NAD(P)H-dependent oxidoreductase [Geomesophilobacter sediminis]
MANLLYITCSIAPPEASRTQTLGQEFLNEYLRWNPRDVVRVLGLYRDPIPRLDLDVHNAFHRMARGDDLIDLSDDERRKVIRLWRLADQFEACDKYVFVTQSLNLWFPAEFKMYVDAIWVPNRSYRLATGRRPETLPGETKRSLHIHAPSYRHGKSTDFSVNYLSTVLGNLGVADQEVALLDQDEVEEGHDAQYEKVLRKLMDLALRF